LRLGQHSAARVRSDCARGARPTATQPRYPRVISRRAPQSACSHPPSPSRAPLRSQDACVAATFPCVIHRRSAVHRAASGDESHGQPLHAAEERQPLRPRELPHRNAHRPRAGQVVHSAPRCLPGAYQELRAVCARDVRCLTVLLLAPRPPQVQPKPSQAKPRCAKSSRAKPRQATPSQVKPSQVKPSQAKSSQANSSQVKSSQAKPSQLKPTQAKPSQACQVGQAKPSRLKPSQANSSPLKSSPLKCQVTQVHSSQVHSSSSLRDAYTSLMIGLVYEPRRCEYEPRIRASYANAVTSLVYEPRMILRTSLVAHPPEYEPRIRGVARNEPRYEAR